MVDKAVLLNWIKKGYVPRFDVNGRAKNELAHSISGVS
jgi:hypothetical protein